MSKEIAAYFYPHDHTDPGRKKEAEKKGIYKIPSDMELLACATPLFDGHLHPTYQVGGQTEWRDSDANAISQQRELAIEAGVNLWIVNAYAGLRDGQKTTELQKPIDLIADQADARLKFCLMPCLTLPRIKLPIGPSDRPQNYERPFDLTFDTFRRIVDFAALYWDRPGYFYKQGLPYLSIYGLRESQLQRLQRQMPHLGCDILEYSYNIYGIAPYLTANAFTITTARELQKLGFPHITTYSFLPDFYENNHDFGRQSESTQVPDLQLYGVQLEKKLREAKESGVASFNPSVVVGWDSSPRGEPGKTLTEVSGKYPYTPIIIDSSPDKFYGALHRVWSYQQRFLPEDDRLITVFAWNELGNGASLLPRLNKDGTPDYSYIQALRKFSQE